MYFEEEIKKNLKKLKKNKMFPKKIDETLFLFDRSDVLKIRSTFTSLRRFQPHFQAP